MDGINFVKISSSCMTQNKEYYLFVKKTLHCGLLQCFCGGRDAKNSPDFFFQCADRVEMRQNRVDRGEIDLRVFVKASSIIDQLTLQQQADKQDTSKKEASEDSKLLHSITIWKAFDTKRDRFSRSPLRYRRMFVRIELWTRFFNVRYTVLMKMCFTSSFRCLCSVRFT